MTETYEPDDIDEPETETDDDRAYATFLEEKVIKQMKLHPDRFLIADDLAAWLVVDHPYNRPVAKAVTFATVCR
jgi:hypothetical protein